MVIRNANSIISSEVLNWCSFVGKKHYPFLHTLLFLCFCLFLYHSVLMDSFLFNVLQYFANTLLDTQLVPDFGHGNAFSLVPESFEMSHQVLSRFLLFWHKKMFLGSLMPFLSQSWSQ